MVLVGNAFLVQGNSDSLDALVGLLESEGLIVSGNSDTYMRTYAHFGVEEARELRERAQSRALGERRLFIVVAPGMTVEAQNALLKTLEEPPGNALFFLLVPAPATLLPTLRSRVQTLTLDEAAVSGIDAEEFLASSPDERLKMLTPLLEKGDDDKRDLGAILMFLSSLERRLQKRPEALPALYRTRKYLGDKGALVKPLLEQTALLLPVVR